MDGKSAQVYPLDVWERTKQRLTSLSIFNPLREKFLNLVQYYGQIVEMDAEGTLLIPARLHQSVQFRGDVLVLDNGTYLEEQGGTVANQSFFRLPRKSFLKEERFSEVTTRFIATKISADYCAELVPRVTSAQRDGLGEGRGMLRSVLGSDLPVIPLETFETAVTQSYSRSRLLFTHLAQHPIGITSGLLTIHHQGFGRATNILEGGVHMRATKTKRSLFIAFLFCSVAALAQQSAGPPSDMHGSGGRVTQAGAIPANATQTVSVPYTPGLDVSAMDKTADPCGDFYAYSCGGWQKQNPIPPDQASWSVTGWLTEQTREVLRNILVKAAADDPHRNPISQKIGDYYASCMDETAIDAAGMGALKADLERIAALRTKADLAGYLAHFHPQDIGIYFGSSALFRFGSEQDPKNSAQVIAEVDQGGLGLPDRDYYLKDDARSKELRNKYIAHVQKMLQLIGEKPEAATADAQVVMRIETALAKGMLTQVQRRDPKATYHLMDVTQLRALTPSFGWLQYFAGYGLTDLHSIDVVAPEFFKTMEATIAAEELSSWQAYLRWHLVHAQARWLASPIVEEDFDFYGRTLTGQGDLQPRWERCIRYMYPLNDAVGEAYVESAFSPQAKQRALQMVQQIESAMERDIRGLTWMSDATKQEALAKLRAVVAKVGYPDRWRDYTGLTIVRGDALGNAERSNTFEFLRTINKIGKAVDRTEWMIPPTMVDAAYDTPNNSITFPAAVLQPPLFDMRIDDAPNYGDTGGNIGHELTHGFDDEGRQFDALGNLRDWWQPQDAREFEQRTQCLMDQYAQYTVVEDVKINSKLTVGEDVADLGGLILAYMAWQEETAGKTLRAIDGLTPAQRFFIGYAQGFCSNERPENLRQAAMTDTHSPPKYRANGVVRNMPEFQQAFQCKTGQPMAPERRCRVW